MRLYKKIQRKIDAYIFERNARLDKMGKKPFREKYPNFPLYFSAVAMLIALIAQLVAISRI